jgi:decaprenylphospho-beta-D-ribofuranose 2-oxidase
MTLMNETAGRQLDDQHLHVVAWLDGSAPRGRGIVETVRLLDDDGLAGAGAPTVSRAARIASIPGPGLVTRPLIRVANTLRWHSGADSRWATAPIGRALQPLDQLELWPALFGQRGLLQYQCAVPDGAEATIGRLLHEVTRAGLPPALATLKRLGPAGPGPLSFPLAGWTLAMDFPARWGGLESGLRRLDELVVAAGGRVYLVKDSRMSPETVTAMYPGLDRWRRTRDGMDPTGAFGSDLGTRLGLVPAVTS